MERSRKTTDGMENTARETPNLSCCRGSGITRFGVADRHLAPRQRQAHALSLCRSADPGGTSAGECPEEWLVIEWPKTEAAPTKYHLSNLPDSASVKELVATIHMRWRIERDYQELKDEIGIDHFEGRGWRGFHHHAALCIAAYGFIAAERARTTFSPKNISFVPVPPGDPPKQRGSPNWRLPAVANLHSDHQAPHRSGPDGSVRQTRMEVLAYMAQ
jgi:hypothetical protein